MFLVLSFTNFSLFFWRADDQQRWSCPSLEPTGALLFPGSASSPGAVSASGARPLPLSAGRARAGSSLLPEAVQLSAELTGNRLQMHEVTKTASGAFPHLILATASLSEVRHWRQLGPDWLTVEPSIVQTVDRCLCILLTAVLHVDIANKMVSQIVTHVHFFNFSILLLQFCENLLKEIVKVLLHFYIWYIGDISSICTLRSILWILVNVGQNNCLTECWLVVKSRATVSMATCTNLEVEGTVDSEKKSQEINNTCCSPLLNTRWCLRSNVHALFTRC